MKSSIIWSVLHGLMPTQKRLQTQANTAQADTQRPPDDDKEAWRKYWEERGQPWRREPEIDKSRQQELAQRRTLTPDIEQGIYPFKGLKLSRADIEWLLETHENGCGPVDWNDEGQRAREGLDLRGADLQKNNLSGLPLAGMIGGLTGRIWFSASPEQGKLAAVRMQGALLIQTQLAGAKLNAAYLDRANLYRSHLEQAELWGASLKGASLSEARLGGAILKGAHLEGADLDRAHLEGVSTDPADLTWAVFDSTTVLRGITLGNAMHGYIRVADVNWGGANLTVVKWSQMDMLGEEQKARQKIYDGKKKEVATRLEEIETAVRANRQLANALQAQALNEDAARFAYRAQVLQERVLWYQIIRPSTSWDKVMLRQRVSSFFVWLYSCLLYLLAGYGYRIHRSFLTYLAVIGLFTVLYHLLVPGLAWQVALEVSLNACLSRGIPPSAFQAGDLASLVSDVEAFIGLVIEVVFIATLTQRFFNK